MKIILIQVKSHRDWFVWLGGRWLSDENYQMVNFDHRSLIHSRYGSDLVRTRISFLKRCFQPKRWFLDSYLERIINQLKQFVTFDIHVLERIHFDNGLTSTWRQLLPSNTSCHPIISCFLSDSCHPMKVIKYFKNFEILSFRKMTFLPFY